ncbi:PREDICTED: ninein-like protein [Tinamus guttatus]|uniref:ninein-like protein n=1 Tax=Tinamus guttatus TaxID=94827 RepID=UPI00052F19CC|nr:PREDICTED: ninein-like protein [Tinamus guttatus]
MVPGSSIQHAAVASCARKLQCLRIRVRQISRERDRARLELEEAERRCLQLVGQVDEHRAAREDSQGRLRKIQTEMKAKDLLLQQATQRQAKLEADAQLLQGREANLQGRLNVTMKENTQLQNKIMNMSEKLSATEKLVLELQKELDLVTKDKRGQAEPRSAESPDQRERFAEIVLEYERQCRVRAGSLREALPGKRGRRHHVGQAPRCRCSRALGMPTWVSGPPGEIPAFLLRWPLEMAMSEGLCGGSTLPSVCGTPVTAACVALAPNTSKEKATAPGFVLVPVVATAIGPGVALAALGPVSAAGTSPQSSPVPGSLPPSPPLPAPACAGTALPMQQLQDQLQDLKVQLEAKVNHYQQEMELMKKSFERERKASEEKFKAEMTKVEEQKKDLEETAATYWAIIDGLKEQKCVWSPEPEEASEPERAEAEQQHPEGMWHPERRPAREGDELQTRRGDRRSLRSGTAPFWSAPLCATARSRLLTEHLRDGHRELAQALRAVRLQQKRTEDKNRALEGQVSALKQLVEEMAPASLSV